MLEMGTPSWFIIGGLLVAGMAGSASAVAARAASVTDGVYQFTLGDALGTGTDLTVHLDCRNGTFRQGFALAPAYNTAVHDVDAGALTLTGTAVAGEVAITLNPSTLPETNQQQTACHYHIRAAVQDGVVIGSYTGTFGAANVAGTVAGELRARPALPQAAKVDLRAEDAVISGAGAANHGYTRAYLGFSARDGQASAGRLVTSPDGWSVAPWSGAVQATQLTLTETTLAGTVTAAIAGDGQEILSGAYTYTLDGTVVGDSAAGHLIISVNGKEMRRTYFAGAIAPVTVTPQNATYLLGLNGALAGGKPLRIYLTCKDGVFTQGFGIAPIFNRTFHDVDTSGLTLDGTKVTGTLAVTIHPDQWVPADHQPVACTYTLDAEVSGANLTGTYQGRYGAAAVQGSVYGDLEEKRAYAGTTGVSLKFIDGLTGGEGWQNRCWISFTLAGGTATPGAITNNKPHCGWAGTVDAVETVFDGDTLRGTATVTITPKASDIEAGVYTFAFDGKVIGKLAVGTAQIALNGRPIKTDRFIGDISER